MVISAVGSLSCGRPIQARRADTGDVVGHRDRAEPVGDPRPENHIAAAARSFSPSDGSKGTSEPARSVWLLTNSVTPAPEPFAS